MVTALDLRIVKASESVDDLFSDRDISRSGPIRPREQQGTILISLRQCYEKLRSLEDENENLEREYKCTIHTEIDERCIAQLSYKLFRCS